MVDGSLSPQPGAAATVAPKKSDLGVRTASAVVMLAVVGGDLWLGGWWWTALVVLVGLGVIWEWRALVWQFVDAWPGRFAWMTAGLLYVGIAGAMLAVLRDDIRVLLAVVLGVIATDIGAYFAGRSIGGPKIAPRLSPSKTWAGLFGGMLAAAVMTIAVSQLPLGSALQPAPWAVLAVSGSLIAVVAQAGDFFESWMKRRAGVKDSGRLIPGHGGLFDRVDGLIAVLFVLGLVSMAMAAVALLSGESLLPSPA